MELGNLADQWPRSAAASEVGAELRATLALAAPLAAANLAQMAMGVTNTVMVGRLGAMPLAAAGARERPSKGRAPTGTGGALYCRVLIVVSARAYPQAPRQRRECRSPSSGVGMR